MRTRLANFTSWLLEFLPSPVDTTFRFRWSSPVPGTRYRVRSRITVVAVTLPLDSNSQRAPISLPPTTTIFIHAATRPDAPHVYAVTEAIDVTDLLRAAKLSVAGPSEYLLTIPRRILEAQCMRF